MLFVTSWKYNQTGHGGQLKWLGSRRIIYFYEGWRFIPWWLGFTILVEDLREIPTEFDEMLVYSSNNAEFQVRKAKVIWQIFDLNKYHDLESEGGKVQKLLDDVFDQDVRQIINHHPWREILGMNFSKHGSEICASLARWGINLISIIVPEVLPVSKHVIDAIEGEMRMIQFDELVAHHMKPVAEGGGGMNKEEAEHQARLDMGETTDNRQTFKIEGNEGGGGLTAAALAKIAGRE